MNTYLAASVGGVAVLFGFGLWSAFTAGLRRGRAVERARADRRIHDTALPALDAIALIAVSAKVRRVAREHAASLRQDLDRRRGSVRLSEDLAGVVAEQERSGLRTRLQTCELDARVDAGLPAEQRSALREATGEALRNTARHSGVREAEVMVETRDGGIAVTARDAGSGFDMDACDPGFGIGESIVARMSEVGGSATIESRPGVGTRVTLWVPV
jgi:signal transduction histidine kinase